MILIRRKYYFYKRVKQNAIPYSVYQAYCNTLGKKMDEAKVVYLRNKFQAFNNNKSSTWKLSNSFLGKPKNNSHDLSINHNDTLITVDLQLVNIFNNYFSKICSELRQQISISVEDPLLFFDDTDTNDSAFRFYESTPDEVGMLIS